MKLKPEYVPMLSLWAVYGEGYFRTYDDACRRIEEIRESKQAEREATNKSTQINVALTQGMMNDLVRLSDERGVKPVELIRLLIEKEVNGNG